MARSRATRSRRMIILYGDPKDAYVHWLNQLSPIPSSLAKALRVGEWEIECINVWGDDGKRRLMDVDWREYALLLIHVDRILWPGYHDLSRRIRSAAPQIDIAICGYYSALRPVLQDNLDGRRVIALGRDWPRALAQYCLKSDSALVDRGDSDYVLDLVIRDGRPTSRRHVTLRTSVGCPFACTFCRIGGSAVCRTPYRTLPLGVAASNLDQALGDSDRLYVRIADKNFLGTPKTAPDRAKALVRLFGRRDARIQINCRSDALSPEVADLLALAGVINVNLGVESMSNIQLERYAKRLTAHDHRLAARVLQERGIMAQGYAILLDPWSTIEEVRHNLAGLLELGSAMFIKPVLQLTLFDGTELYRRYLDAVGAPRSTGLVRDYAFIDRGLRGVVERLAEIYGELNCDRCTGRADTDVSESDAKHRNLTMFKLMLDIL